MKISVIACLFFMITLASCNFNYSESGKEVNIEEDGKELALAKKSLQFIEENKTDSLKGLFTDEVLKNIKQEQLEWLVENGNILMVHNEYPHDSILTVSTTTRKSISGGEEIFKEFNFPFIDKDAPDSTMYFKVTVVGEEIYKLMISTGWRG